MYFSSKSLERIKRFIIAALVSIVLGFSAKVAGQLASGSLWGIALQGLETVAFVVVVSVIALLLVNDRLTCLKEADEQTLAHDPNALYWEEERQRQLARRRARIQRRWRLKNLQESSFDRLRRIRGEGPEQQNEPVQLRLVR